MRFINAPILAYHEIAPGTPPADYKWAVSLGQFKREVQYLHDHGYVCVSLAELLQDWDTGRPRRRKAVALTFDDGFRDFFTLAAPILGDYGFTATVFVITGRTRWQRDLNGEVDNAYLTWEQIKALQKSSFSFGSHTCTHPWLHGLSRENIQKELVTSKECLEAKLGQPVQWLCYPYGYSTREIQEMAMVAGYAAAFGGSPGGSWGRYNIRRHFCLGGDTLVDFALGLNSYFRCFEHLRKDARLLVRRVKHGIGF